MVRSLQTWDKALSEFQDVKMSYNKINSFE